MSSKATPVRLAEMAAKGLTGIRSMSVPQKGFESIAGIEAMTIARAASFRVNPSSVKKGTLCSKRTMMLIEKNPNAITNA